MALLFFLLLVVGPAPRRFLRGGLEYLRHGELVRRNHQLRLRILFPARFLLQAGHVAAALLLLGGRPLAVGRDEAGILIDIGETKLSR